VATTAKKTTAKRGAKGARTRKGGTVTAKKAGAAKRKGRTAGKVTGAAKKGAAAKRTRTRKPPATTLGG
jgi:hypothetical protein